jgi:hypothetical protein
MIAAKAVKIQKGRSLRPAFFIAESWVDQQRNADSRIFDK